MLEHMSSEPVIDSLCRRTKIKTVASNEWMLDSKYRLEFGPSYPEMIHDMDVRHFKDDVVRGGSRSGDPFVDSVCNVLGLVAQKGAKSWIHTEDLSSMVAAFVQWVVSRSCCSVIIFISAVYSKQVLCMCCPVLAYG